MVTTPYVFNCLAKYNMERDLGTKMSVVSLTVKYLDISEHNPWFSIHV